MQSLYILIPIACIVTGIAIRLIIWAIDNKQYDDLDRESVRILEDD